MIERYSNPEMARVWSDKNKLDKWLQVEVASCEAWAELGAIPASALTQIRQASYDEKRIDEVFKETRHDMTAFLASVTDSVGEEGRFIHFGLTSSDVIDTALSLQIIEAADLLEADIARLIAVLKRQALTYKDTIMTGRTHGVHAEPMTFGFKLALWYDEMQRNAFRLRQARETISVGKVSGAVGTHANVPPFVEEFVCKKLGIDVAPVSTQIIQRDRHAQFVTTLGIIASSLDKFATDLRSMQRTEIREVEERFSGGQTGSSAMPHKRNPELCERVSGLARVVRGYSVTAMENMVLWHERDISNSSVERIILPDACLVLDYILGIFTQVMDNLQVYPERMKKNLGLTHGLLFSQRVLLALIEKGMSRQSAYKIVQCNAMKAWEEDLEFLTLLAQDPLVSARMSSSELEGLFNYDFHLQYIDTAYERLGLLTKPIG
ncbi:MAG: adenylosuccinate lyase [Dehalococcoidia bacterium]|nr:adenylosuccinate lyase [Dehalococcoidia bacterium]